jgi:hypothetical protein
MRYRSSNPYPITARFAGKCSRCKAAIAKGSPALYFPSDRSMLCDGDDCGRQHQRDLAADDFDQAQYQ